MNLFTRFSDLTKKALYCAFFCAYLISVTPAKAISSKSNCQLAKNQVVETTFVKYVHDGDTIRLRDNRKVRLIGIDTPELARKNKPAQPYAQEAKQALEALISSNQNKILLVYDKDKFDKYDRTLAHLFLTNGINIQSKLVHNGYAVAYTTPPNDKYAECYFTAENSSRLNKRGLWSHKRYEILKANMLNTDTRGFRIIETTLQNIASNKQNIWLNLDGKINAHIREKDIQHFNLTQLKSYVGQTVRLRGWLHPKKDSFYLTLRHPSAIKPLEVKQPR